MKILILTQPLIDNYGGILQNYALQTVLKRRGHSVETLNVETPLPWFVRNYWRVRSMIKPALRWLLKKENSKPIRQWMTQREKKICYNKT